MKKLLIGVIVTFIAVFTLTIGVLAAPNSSAMAPVGPYDGTFKGHINGDRGSSAPVTLNLTHRGDLIKGSISLGEGLYIDGGWCGKGNVPAMTQYSNISANPRSPERIQMHTNYKVSGFDIGITLNSNLSRNGVIAANGRIDLPWFCGRDPQLNGTLYKM